MIKKSNDTSLYDSIESRNIYFALTMFYFVVIFGFTVYVNFFYVFKSLDFFVPRFIFAIVFTVMSYYFILRQFIRFLHYRDVGEELSFSNSVAVTITIAVFILDTLVVFFMFIILLYLLGAIFHGILTGEFTALSNFF